MDSALSKYNENSSALRERLNQAAANRPSGASLTDGLQSKHADVLYNVRKHVVHGPMLLKYPSRVRGIQSNDDVEESSEKDEEEEESDGEFDPSLTEIQYKRALAGEGAVVVGNRTVLVHDYLGQQATATIEKLQNIQPFEGFPGLSLRLWDYQKTGIAKILECWRGAHSSCILADEMGLGKTIQTILACLSDRDDRPTCFNLIVTTKTCVKQWERQLQTHFDENERPSCKVLDSSRTTARELIEGRYDFVICSYGFLQSQYRDLLQYQKFFEAVEDHGQKTAEETTKLRVQQRRRLSLFSDLYSTLGLPISHLVLDEAQYAKNWETLTHRAIKALVYRKYLAVTGTPMANRWWDIYGMILFMKNHPFLQYADFIRIFGQPRNHRADPPPSKLPRLVKFLMQVTVSRPASLLDLPGMDITRVDFRLSVSDADSVLLYTKLFIDSLRQSKHDLNNASFRTATSARRALVFATRAQQHAAHPALMEQAMAPQFKSKLQKMASIRATVAKMFSKESLREYATMLLSALEAAPPLQTVPEITKRTGESETEGEGVKAEDDDDDDYIQGDPDYDPNKDLDVDVEDDEDEALVQDTNEEEEKKDLRKRWMTKVAKMTDKILTSPRIEAVDHVYDKIKSKNKDERIVIFSKYVKFLDMIAELLKRRRGVVCLRLDGSSTKEQRESTTKSFTSVLGSVLLITPKTGGAGLNGLECASKLIQCEPWWTSTEEAQAYGRLFRPTQYKVVDIYYLQGEDSTIDCLIERIRDGKSLTNEKIMGPLRRKDDEPPVIPKIYEWY